MSSDTKHPRNPKGFGFEYWTARPGNKHGGTWSRHGNRWFKKQTHRAERRQGKRDCQQSKD